MAGSECCGLLNNEFLPIPLQGISVDVQVKGFVADVSATLKYKNKEENAVEAIFVFPMDLDAAVYSFEAIIEGMKIVADLQEKKQAQKTYDEAIEQGQQAFLLQEDVSSGDIFSCNVGNLLPGQEAEITLKYVAELAVEADGAVRFVLPAVLNPRYTPEGEKDNITAILPNVPISKLPYTLNLKARFQSSYGINKIECSSDITPIKYTNDDKTEAKVALAEGHKFDRDIELLVYYNEVNKPSVILESGVPDAGQDSFMTHAVAMLNFYPSFPESQGQAKCGEFIFVVDRSGSMQSPMNSEPNAPSCIQSAKDTLILLLKSLPLGCYFNVYSFGSTFEYFFGESVEYTQETLEEAVEKVNQMSANLGGTEILEPLQKIYKTPGRPQHPRQVFVFTDGAVGNTHQVIAEVQRNSHNHRCFTFGIGEGASTALVKGMARAGNGNYDFITGKDRLQPKVLRAMKCALQPTVKDISLNWTLPPDVEQNLVAPTPNAIFQGQRAIIYVQLKGKLEEEKEVQVSLQYNFKDETFTNELRFPLQLDDVERPTIHKLAAKKLISFLEYKEEDTEEVKKKILETSLQSGVVSSLTAYVAVNKDTKTRLEGRPVQRVNPPVAMACCFMPPPVAVCHFGAPVAIPDMAPDPVNESADSTFEPPRAEVCYFGMPPERPVMESPDPIPVCPDSTFEPPRVEVCYFGIPPEKPVMESPDPIPECPDSTFEPPRVEVCYFGVPPEMPVMESPDPIPECPVEISSLYKLITLQKADGSWEATSEFANILGILENFTGSCPVLNVEVPVWATVLAVIWLHSSYQEEKEEWELLGGKAISWVRDKAGSTLAEVVKAGNEFLKSLVDVAVFGL